MTQEVLVVANSDEQWVRQDPSHSTRAFFGDELRYHREAAGLSTKQLADMLFVSTSMVGHMETGRRRMQPEIAELADRVLETNGFFARRCNDARPAGIANHFAEAYEAEQRAVRIREFSALLVPGLLQTEGYARAVFRAVHQVMPDDELQESVRARIARARVLDDPKTPEYTVMFDESVLHRPVGGGAVMAAQLRHLAKVIRSHRVRVHVLPYAVGAHAALEGPLRLLTCPDEPPMSYVEGLASGRLLDEPVTVAQHEELYVGLMLEAWPCKASLERIESAAKELDDYPELAQEQLQRWKWG
ncbi:helix-turn-helix domain-containing protein [Streptomyces sp. CMB-StM0423]|uniref:helix-turn-helix domain-containing protein n=1 Tax=Streptomyces sp. CMB-StM0423 TaxID=2059884 RepID=UPI000C70B968|nr:helix-turn-helix transcriptional regulator [Streptomyces sp. CMB-StM0423]AUH44327.1 transcriptional regulator [Streptomyces sp. CMB-StM0423]